MTTRKLSGGPPPGRPPLGADWRRHPRTAPPAPPSGAPARARLAAALLAGLACLGTGCATRGPLHVYSLTRAAERAVLDTGPGGTTTVPSFLATDDRVTGFAYDPFTDHFFLRLDPGDRIRVVDRPARAIKREFELAPGPYGNGDLAVRPRDGHLFLLGPAPGQVLERTRLGKRVGEITLLDAAGPPTGLAFDTAQDCLLALAADGQRITIHDLQGHRLRELRLEKPAGPSLAFDAEQREFFAPLRTDPAAIGVFDETGRLLRTVPAPDSCGLIDVGQRSLVRVF